jgi:cytochrome P450
MYVIEELIPSCQLFEVHREDFDQCEIDILLQARKRIIIILKQNMAERRAFPKTHNDMLAELLGNENTKYDLSESNEQIYDQVFGILYSGYETVSITTTMAIKYLYGHPKALEELRVGHSFYLSCFNI